MSARSGSLPRYIVQRLLLIIPTIWLIVTLVFILLRVAPGDPVTAAVGGKLDEATRQNVQDAASARALMSAHPSVIRRPVVEWSTGEPTVGFDAELWRPVKSTARTSLRPSCGH